MSGHDDLDVHHSSFLERLQHGPQAGGGAVGVGAVQGKLISSATRIDDHDVRAQMHANRTTGTGREGKNVFQMNRRGTAGLEDTGSGKKGHGMRIWLCTFQGRPSAANAIHVGERAEENDNGRGDGKYQLENISRKTYSSGNDTRRRRCCSCTSFSAVTTKPSVAFTLLVALVVLVSGARVNKLRMLKEDNSVPTLLSRQPDYAIPGASGNVGKIHFQGKQIVPFETRN